MAHAHARTRYPPVAPACSRERTSGEPRSFEFARFIPAIAQIRIPFVEALFAWFQLRLSGPVGPPVFQAAVDTSARGRSRRTSS